MEKKDFTELLPRLDQPIGKKIREIRKKSGKTIREIYGETYTREAVRLVEAGHRHPSVTMIRALGKATEWNYRAYFKDGLHPNINPKIREKKIDRVLDLFLDLPRKEADTVLAVLSDFPVHSPRDFRNVCKRVPELKEQKNAMLFLAMTCIGL